MKVSAETLVPAQAVHFSETGDHAMNPHADRARRLHAIRESSYESFKTFDAKTAITVLRSAALTLVTAAIVLATAPPASAEPSPPGCPKGYFCAWDGPNWTGRMVLRTYGNWSGGVWAVSVFNNGHRLPGADHVDVIDEASGISTYCFHYNPGPGHYKASFHNVFPNHELFITSVVWRGEC